MLLELLIRREWFRVAGELIEDDRVEARQSMLDAYPSLQKMYSAMMAIQRHSILETLQQHFLHFRMIRKL